MATRIESVRNLVSAQSIAFIRPVNLSVKLAGGRPNTPMNVFFDGVNVNAFCTASTLTTDSAGALTTTLSIPGGRFTTGAKKVTVTDAAAVSQLSVPGSTFGSGVATFTSNGVLETYQRITTTVTTVVVEQVIQLPPVNTPVDPIAQSFFTYGVKGGVFVTGIELYFNSKDEAVPVKVDVRPMENGVPVKFGPSNPDWICIKPASEINISPNASVGTVFRFPVPIYLEEDRDYCFVVFSNSKKYNLYTSRMGENSIETGKRIFDQPYVGSMFRSENNITWTAEQFDDIKFRIYQAKFTTNQQGTLGLMVAPNFWAVPGTSFQVESGSNTVRVNMTVKHGLTPTSKAYILGSPSATYKGIAAAGFTGVRDVQSVIDEYTFTYNADNPALSSGTVVTGGQVTYINVTNGGNSYTTAPTVSFTGGGGSGAAAVAKVVDGKVSKIEITAPGTGYTTAPTVSFTGGGGSSAAASVSIDAMFTVLVNMPVTSIAPNIPAYKFSDCSLAASVSTVKMSYENADVSYTSGGAVNVSVNGNTALPNYSVIASAYNEEVKLGNLSSMLLRYNFSTTNSNVSPVIDLRNSPSIIAYGNSLRSQAGEDPTASNSTGQLNSITLLNSGSGYTVAPTVSVVSDSGTGATATAVLSTSGVSEVDIDSGGSGYTSAPTVAFSGGGGTGAAGTAVLAPTSVASIALTSGGTNYTTAPTVVFIGGGGGTGATATTALTTVGLASVTVGVGGSGYTTAPTVSFTGGGGSGATATATVSGGQVTAITLTDPGSGYTTAPTVSFTGGGGTGATATANLLPKSVTSITLTGGGSGYTIAPSVTFSGGGGTGAAASTTLSTRSVQSVTVTNGGSGYTSAPTVAFSGGGGTGATATAQIAGKTISEIIVTNAGSGYSSIPEIVVSRTDGSTGVDAVAIGVLSTFNSEVSPSSGNNLSRYITKRITLETPSTGITLFSEIYSEIESNVDWYIRTSTSGTGIDHTTLNWVPLQCDQQRNRSSNANERIDYKFYKYGLPAFDTYDLKCVLRSNNPIKAPKVYNYRVIIVA